MSGKNPARIYAKEFVGGGGLTTVQAASVAAAIVAATPAADATGTVYGDVAGGLLGPLVVQALHGDEAAVTLAGDVDDYDLGDGLRDAFYWLIDFGGFDVSGFAAPGTPGELHCIVNTGTAGNLLASSGGSAAENQILSASGDVAVATDAAILIAYSGTLERWVAVGATGSGSSGGRPPWDFVVAASDTDPALQAIADLVCDGTADDVQINAAIAAHVTAARNFSTLILTGSYAIAAKLDFTGWVALGGTRQVFEARGATFIAAAALTTMVDVGPGAGGQIVTSADIRLGRLDGNAASFSVSRGIYMRRFNDSKLSVEDVYNFTGDGWKVDEAGVSDYPCGNNELRYGTIHNCLGTGFYVLGGTNPYGFQGNIVTGNETTANGNGMVLGGAANQNMNHNLFILGPVEHNTNAGIYDYGGGNTFIITNTNSNGTQGLGAPTGVNLPSIYITRTDDPIDAAVLDQHSVLNYGTWAGITEFLERATSAATPAAGHLRIYAKTDHKLYYKRSDGTEVEIGSGGGVTGFAAPAFTFGTSAAAGSATTAVRSDATLALFDATVPTTSAEGDAAAVGSAGVAARRDHRHGREAFGTTAAAIGTSAGGAATTPSKSDHVHATGAGVPSTQAIGDAAATGAGPAAAMTDHKHAMPGFGSPVATGTANADGTAATIARSDHVHQGATAGGASDHIHIVGERFVSDGATVAYMLAQEAVPNTIGATLAGLRKAVTLGGMNDVVTLPSAGSAGDEILVDYVPLQV